MRSSERFHIAGTATHGTVSLTRRAAILLLACLLLAPMAEARSVPALYFLKDGETPVIENGILNTTIPSDNATKTRVIPVGSQDILPVRFVTDAEEAHPLFIRGPLFVGLWTGESPMVHGNLTATFYIIDGEDLTPIGNGSINLDANTSRAPDPLALVPPDPTNPQAAVFHVVGQLVPMIMKPPTLISLGIVDLEVPEGAQIGVGFRLDPGTSPAPLPVGAFAQIQYDSMLQPSFAFVPWFEPDPPKPATPPAASTPPPANPPAQQPPPPAPSNDSKDSPGPGALLFLALLGAALFARRR